MRKVFLDELPRRGKLINWKKSVGYIVKFTYDDIEGEVEIVGYFYECGISYLYIKYKDKEIFRIQTYDFKNCQLGYLLKKHTNEFKIEIGTTFKDDKRDITIIDREYRIRYDKNNNKYNDKWYKYKCNKCGWGEGRIVESSLIKGNGCACCCNPSQIVVEGINDIPTTAPWMIKYFHGGYDEAKKYTKSSDRKIKVKCPDCQKIKDKEMFISNIYANHSIGCTCGDGFSYGHKYIFSLLSQLNLDFQENRKIDWCVFPSYKDKSKISKGEYDFVIEDKKLIIEVDGDFHRKNNRMNGQTKEESKYLDDMKDLKAHENGYRVIRISDEDNIKDNILNGELIGIFDLSKIDWFKCEEFALGNRVKEACEIKRDSPDMTCAEIGRIMKLSNTTIKRYLKQGSKIWSWCEYDPEVEKYKNNIKNSERNKKFIAKPIEIFKNGISLGVFESATELERRSEELFGVKLNFRNISLVCTGRRKSHKGFTFRFVQ